MSAAGARRCGQPQQLHSWAYAQLRDQITYKAHAAGVPVQVIDPRNTSKTCHQCGHCDTANRRSQALFRCAGADGPATPTITPPPTSPHSDTPTTGPPNQPCL
ncbi:hypothetical protein ROP_42980 [Rhodococcus opacus B4]|uniref:Cas12f1-like TNB domain-containing protein n=1 Tax=Rhodococcus opacus (strain B4) TaxID=632772 RepID=C1BA42_RHOOB|nr:zinc ribbon domain-containing protein [Rhodococcus opacus]BAH52545.1 hypothetical protein ROP_42980 [Rhodococcus opacus B4]